MVHNLQLVLFLVPILYLLVLGLLILFKPVTILDRRWMLLAFFPILLDNLLAIFGNETLSLAEILRDGYFWLILGADLAIGIGITLTMRGYAVYGLTPEQVELALVQAMTDAGYVAGAAQGEWKSNWGRASEAVIITWETKGQSRSCAITSRTGEVMVRTKARSDLKQLPAFIGKIRNVKNPYEFSQHAVGVLYLVMAFVLAVFGWIYFFEPRLILIE
ncbi:MAG TPA: hypothetical protein DF984_06100 [Anaerolineaceae bacterium]|nr:hypothetical protein [Anaerolineaceae bacterium]